MGLFRFVGLSTLLAVSGFALPQAVPPSLASDAEIDAAVGALRTDFGRNSCGRLQVLARANWPRTIWNYRRADGNLRARILISVHYDSSSEITPMLELASRDPGSEIRRMAANYIGNIGEESRKNFPSIEKMQNSLLHDPSWKVRTYVAKTLTWRYRKEVPGQLTRLTRDPSPFVRIQAGLSLAKREDARAIPVLVRLLAKWDEFEAATNLGPEWNVRTTLSRFGAKVVPFLEPKLKSRSAPIRGTALEVLTGADAPKLFEYGSRMIGDPNPRVRFLAYRAVAWNKRPESIPILIKALEDKGMVAENSSIADNVRSWLKYGPRMDDGSWAEGLAALKKFEERRGKD